MRSLHIGLAASLLLVAACAPSKGPEQPSTASSTDAAHDAGSLSHAQPADMQLLAALPSAKLTLQQGIALAEQRSGVPISAKFEIEDGKFSLSVYTAKKGIEPDAEHNELAELSGDPTLPAWQPKEEIFADASHIKRASMHLTLLQRSRSKLSDVIAKALAQQPGDVYSVTPDVVDRKPKFHVAIATGGGKSALVDIEGS